MRNLLMFILLLNITQVIAVQQSFLIEEKTILVCDECGE